MYRLIIACVIAVALPDAVLAGKRTSTKSSSNSVPITTPGTYVGNNTTYTATGNINGSVDIKGSNNTLVNNGNISGTNTGVTMTGGGSSTLINNGTISAKSTGTSTSTSIGISQGN